MTEQYLITQDDKELIKLTKKSYEEAYHTISKVYYTNFDDKIFSNLDDIKDRTVVSPFKIILFVHFPTDYKKNYYLEFLDKDYEDKYNRFHFALRLNQIISIGINKLEDFCSIVFFDADSSYFTSPNYRIINTDSILDTIDKLSNFWGAPYVH